MPLKSTRSRLIAAVALVVVLAAVALTLRLFVYPDLNAPERSDAIVVLGGNGRANGHLTPTPPPSQSPAAYYTTI